MLCGIIVIEKLMAVCLLNTLSNSILIMRRVAQMFNNTCHEINESAWFIASANNLNNLHDYLKKNLKIVKTVIGGDGFEKKKFKKITALYKTNNFEEIAKMKDHLINKITAHKSRHIEKHNELINYCIFLEEYKNSDYITCDKMANELLSSLDKRNELGRLIDEIVTKMNDEKKSKSLRLSQMWLTKYGRTHTMIG